ncbi:cupin domain-containing protein [Paenibacillus puerhi]|uniref:cupin domain-containing protein n=1 Tax=Paenibacillus puerhi TaxID=2692622 RepID=UPI001359E001|nr:cupin domain-containing protein [Paenibacillus puerhi]
MISYMDYTSPATQFFFDLSNKVFYKKDDRNYIHQLGIQQLNTLGNNSLLDIYLSAGNIVEPHIHQNASELVYCIAGAAVVSLINPFTNELLNIPIKPGQVANVPQGWWHYEIASVDHTHLLAVFDAPTPEAIFGSDILRLTPPSVLARSYCLDETKVAEALAPIRETIVIGPPSGCPSSQVQGSKTNMPHHANPSAGQTHHPSAYHRQNCVQPQTNAYQPYAHHPQQQPYAPSAGYRYSRFGHL